MNLTRSENGTLPGTYQMGAGEAIAFVGKILESKDNDLYLDSYLASLNFEPTKVYTFQTVKIHTDDNAKQTAN
jgi:hypothetical protein